MARNHAADDYQDDPEEPDESDMDADEGDDSGIETEECPHCGADVHEFAERCPACGRYVSREEAPRGTHPRWVIATATVLLLIMLYALLKWWL